MAKVLNKIVYSADTEYGKVTVQRTRGLEYKVILVDHSLEVVMTLRETGPHRSGKGDWAAWSREPSIPDMDRNSSYGTPLKAWAVCSTLIAKHYFGECCVNRKFINVGYLFK